MLRPAPIPAAAARPPAVASVAGARVVPPLLPIWLPLIIAAIVSGVVLAWAIPPVHDGAAAPPARFTDITAAAGLAMVHQAGADPAAAPTTLGAGVVFFDCDGDGDDDLFLVNGTAWPWEESLAKLGRRGGCVLYRNDGDVRFVDISAAAGVNLEFQGMGAAAGDFDNDGRTDLFVTGVGTSHLFHNRGGGRFEDVTDDAGVRGEDNTWSTGAAWLDADGDGRLDLVVCHYARWPAEPGLAAAFSVALMGHSYGAPTGFIGVPPTLYRNNGDGRFTAVDGSGGLRPLDPLTGRPAAKVLAVTPLEANGDGRLDLFFSFHTMDSVLFLNEGGGRFRSWTPPEARREGASAGVASASSFALLPGGGRDERWATWQAAATIPPLPDTNITRLDAKLGAVLIDYDRDGRMDIFCGSGRAEPDVNRFEGGREFAAVPGLYWNSGDGWTPTELPGMTALRGRALAGSDIDQDGDVDIVLTQWGGAPVLLRNEQRVEIPWLAVTLVATRGPREAGGARVEVHTPRHVHVQTVAPAMGLMAQSGATLHFGLGEDARVRRIEVVWPGGVRQVERVAEINRRITITEN